MGVGGVLGRLGARVAFTAATLGCGLACGAGVAQAAGSLTIYPVGPAGGNIPDSIVAAPDGNLWFGASNSTPDGEIGRISTTGTVSKFDFGDPAEPAVMGIAVGSDGDVWLTTDQTSSEIERIDADGTATKFDTGSGAVLGNIAAGADGNLWFVDRSAIGRITPAGTITEFQAGLANPYDRVAPGSDGNVWFTDDQGSGAISSIGKITPTGTITKYALGAGMSPDWVAEGADGEMWFTYQTTLVTGGLSGLGEVTPNGTITTWTLPSGTAPAALGAGPDGNMWFSLFGLPQEIGTITPDGTISYLSTSGSDFDPILPTTGPDGALWMVGYIRSSLTPAIARLDVGAPAASVSAPILSGTGVQGTSESCRGAAWSSWAGQQPSTGANGYDGYQWLRDGVAIAGADTDAYTPASADVGHALSCRVTATYTLFPATVSATSDPVTILASTGGSGGGGGGGGGGGPPNLHVSVSASPIPHAIGDQFTYIVTVTNEGGASSGSTLSVSLPPQVGYQGFHVDRGPGCSSSGPTLTCNLDFFPPGQTTTVLIGAQVTSTGTATLTTSTYSSPQEYDPTNSEVSFPLTIGSVTPAPPPTSGAEPPPARILPVVLKLAGLHATLLHLGHPSLSFTLNASRTTALTVKLIAKNGKLVGSWRELAHKGKKRYTMLLPARARHAGRVKLELVAAGGSAAMSSSLTLKA